MGKVVIVTGYVSISNPRSESEYHRLGSMLRANRATRFMQCELADTWLHQRIASRAKPATHSFADNPTKNTLAYHCVQHHKTTWMLEAARDDLEADVFVWIDYGIFHQPGVTAEAIDAFLERAQGETAIAIPGCWKKPAAINAINLASPCWRFCGSTIVCHRHHLLAFDAAIRKDVNDRLDATNHVSWEVNAWARVELGGTLPIRWYQADHNNSQFTQYKAV